MDYSKFIESTFPNGKFPVSLEPLFCALGKIVYAWNYVEFYIDSCKPLFGITMVATPCPNGNKFLVP